ncbi:hypothetical protein G3T14_19340 [Methylobacterium sp. BTF04]|uniref:GumC family protein n=1 Tax=Methylobacterium sp. BTF04 TaxID=2708300 RepID=UPI0013D01E8E|nr:Wzz/FepE/Etk N-terminal domain-containing protein [Methylobacterium sp. BTF04]NEU14264.1 hypothetical protein [Methylobacterium sp. BTF04]
MLRAHTAESSASEDSRSLAAGGSISLQAIGAALRRSTGIVIASIVICVSAAALFCFFSVPTYIATAQLLIEPQKQQQLLWFEPGMLDLTLDNAQVESQVEILRSERLAGAVVTDLKLLQEPEFRGAVGTTAPTDGRPETIAEARHRSRETTALLAKHVGVRRVGQSYVIELTAWSYQPDLAAAIANAYASAYLRDQFDAKSQAARQGVDWLKERIGELRVTLNDAARAVEDFKARNELVTSTGGLLVEQQLSETNTQYVSAQSQTAQASARLERIRAVGRAADGSASVIEALNNPVITKLRERQQDASLHEAELRDRYGPDHESVANARRDVAKAEAEIATELQRISQTYLSDYEVATSRERNLRAQIHTLVAEVERRRQSKVVLSELEAQAESYRKMYQNLLEKLTETAQKETLPVSSARIVAAATAPLGKSSPKTSLLLALGGAFGLLGGIVIGTVRNSLDRSVRTPNDITDSTNLDCLGLIPVVQSPKHGETTDERSDPLRYVVVESPFSPFTRALRGVKLTIDACREGRTTTTLGIASVATGEGKSSIALNLAALYAQANFRTLLIDADFLNAALTRMNAPTATEGLIEMLADVGDLVLPTALPNLSFLPLVTDQRLVQSSDILSSRQAHSLLDSFATAYDVVIVDLTAMRESVDVRAVCRLLDGLVLVAAWGETQTGTLAEAAAALEAAQAHVFGVVINKVRDTASVTRAI